MDNDTNPYINLPYLDNINQKIVVNGYVNKLKQPLRNAVNANRTQASAMQELLDLLEDTLAFIKQNDKPKKKVYKKKDDKVEYTLP